MAWDRHFFFGEGSAHVPFSPMHGCSGKGTLWLWNIWHGEISARGTLVDTIQGCFGMGTFQHRDLMAQGPLGRNNHGRCRYLMPRSVLKCPWCLCRNLEKKNVCANTDRNFVTNYLQVVIYLVLVVD